MRRVHLLGTGGTISSRSGPDGLAARATSRELLAAAGTLDGVEVQATDAVTRLSFALTLQDAADIVQQARACLADGVDGVVVTHGTDTMEETAFLADLVHDDDRPIVLTGAQRGLDAVGTDGPGNLAAALRVAASPAARGLGVLLCFDGLAFAARGVRKVHTLSARGFAAPDRGPLLRVAGDTVVPLARPVRARPVALDLAVGLPRVDVVACYVGADATLLRAAVAAGAVGVVLEAFGAGNSPPVIADAIGDLVRAGVHVLVSSRVPAGPVLPLYTGGGGADLARAGAVLAGDLSPWQARLLLAVALAARPDDPACLVRELLAA